jgi:plastocyanin
MNSSHIRRAAACAVGVIGLIALAGCGGKEKVKQSLSVSETEPSANHYAFEGVKSLRPGATKITFTNSGKNPHELQLVRVTGNQAASELTAALQKLGGPGVVPIPEWLRAAGGVGPINPGAKATGTVVLKPGRYFVIDGQSGQGNNAPPFYTQGAITTLDVKGSSVGGSLPSTSKQITVKDVGKDKFRFDNSALRAGVTTITFDNTSKQDHHLVAFRLLPGKTLADAKKAFATQGPPSGPPPVDPQSQTGVPVHDPKTKQVVQVDFTKPGNYVLLCFLKDRDGKGKPHVAEGLLKEIKVS